jgi:hypothetical protein
MSVEIEADIETMLRRELRGAWVPYDPARAQNMIDAATAAPLLEPRRWGAPLAAAAAVVAVSGGATALAGVHSGHRGPAGGGPAPAPTPTRSVAPSSVPATPSVAPSAGHPRPPVARPTRSLAPTPGRAVGPTRSLAPTPAGTAPSSAVPSPTRTG